ncbi:hypothetical protein Dda_9357 [Drechslerella dactyloides]|uniref:Nucleoside phosphorylase domain-containing protein n=1 Tax=Drechslerella dactyloides TaxID=74499 RepID=A0AAD6IPJ5_DREDA|nr:hypothetical protein Dda_9357 [Drechslerella dactyloides]
MPDISPRRKGSDHGSYTIGWLSATQTEYVAARFFLDEKFEEPECLSANDSNNYTLGRIKNHNVVVAVLPDGEYGISAATAVLKDMVHSFPNIRCCLMVGTGGGAPSQKHDIRLGDVAVSAPRDGYGGVLQYDFGKTIQDQPFVQRGFLCPPPFFLRTAMTGLGTKYEGSGNEFEETINNILRQNARLRETYRRPNPNTDKLYKSNVVHPPEDGRNCVAACGDEPSKLIARLEREEYEDNPAVHYGLIASANRLMMDATIRDRLAAKHGVICFEMEAAGLMNIFPCLIIRGIYNYSDSHKNDEWRGVEAERRVAEIPGILSSIEGNMNDIRASFQHVSDHVGHLKTKLYSTDTSRWLLPPASPTPSPKVVQQLPDDSNDWSLGLERSKS